MSLPQPLPSLKVLQEDDKVAHECRDFLSSLPKEPYVVANYLYQYQGCWLSATFVQGVLACQKHFQAQDTDIILASNPKAGTTWLKAILFALVNRVRYSNCQQHPLLMHNPHDLVPFLDIDLYAANQEPDLTSIASPRLFSIHLPYTLLPTSMKDSASKIVYLCRNPKDNFVSYWYFVNTLKPTRQGNISIEEAFDLFYRGVTTYGPYWDNVLSYWKKSLEKPQKVLFLKYEEMKVQPTATLRRVAEFLGCPFSPEEEARGVVHDMVKLCSFDNLKNLEVNKSGRVNLGVECNTFFRRGEVGDWMNYLTADMAEKLDCITEEKYHAVGLRI